MPDIILRGKIVVHVARERRVPLLAQGIDHASQRHRKRRIGEGEHVDSRRRRSTNQACHQADSPQSRCVCPCVRQLMNSGSRARFKRSLRHLLSPKPQPLARLRPCALKTGVQVAQLECARREVRRLHRLYRPRSRLPLGERHGVDPYRYPRKTAWPGPAEIP